MSELWRSIAKQPGCFRFAMTEESDGVHSVREIDFEELSSAATSQDCHPGRMLWIWSSVTSKLNESAGRGFLFERTAISEIALHSKRGDTCTTVICEDVVFMVSATMDAGSVPARMFMHLVNTNGMGLLDQHGRAHAKGVVLARIATLTEGVRVILSSVMGHSRELRDSNLSFDEFFAGIKNNAEELIASGAFSTHNRAGKVVSFKSNRSSVRGSIGVFERIFLKSKKEKTTPAIGVVAIYDPNSEKEKRDAGVYRHGEKLFMEGMGIEMVVFESGDPVRALQCEMAKLAKKCGVESPFSAMVFKYGNEVGPFEKSPVKSVVIRPQD